MEFNTPPHPSLLLSLLLLPPILPNNSAEDLKVGLQDDLKAVLASFLASQGPQLLHLGNGMTNPHLPQDRRED